MYASAETHTWLQKAADLSGLGTSAVRWIAVDADLRMDVAALRTQIERDRSAGDVPLMVVGTAGSVSTGAVDPLRAIAAICREHGAWFHVDGAYGGLAAAVPGASDDLRALAEADSVAVDPHKWLYAPLEAGCALVRDAEALRAAFSYHPPYYHFDGTRHELRRLRAAELPRLPRAQGVARAAAGGGCRLSADDRRRHRAVADDGRRRPRGIRSWSSSRRR